MRLSQRRRERPARWKSRTVPPLPCTNCTEHPSLAHLHICARTKKIFSLLLFPVFIEYFSLACFLLMPRQSIARRLRNSSAGTAVFLQKAQRPYGPCGPAPTHARFRRDSSKNGRRDILGIFSDPALHWPMNPSLCGRRKGDDGGSTLPFTEAQVGTGSDTDAAEASPAHSTKAGRGGNPAPGRPRGLPEIASGRKAGSHVVAGMGAGMGRRPPSQSFLPPTEAPLRNNPPPLLSWADPPLLASLCDGKSGNRSLPLFFF